MASADIKNLSFGNGELKIGGVAVTATAAELNVTDGVTAGTVSASKALVADSSGQIAGIKPLTEVITTNRTVTNAESGINLIADAVDLTVTLPATVEGMLVTVTVKTISASTGVSISPNASDKIMGGGITPADDKDLINTAATDAVGDTVTLLGDGVDGWIIINKIGTWARQA